MALRALVAVFPRQQWAMNLLTVMTSAVALAVSWRLLRDHLDKNRALLGLFALMLIRALRREGRSAQCQHRDDPGMGGGAAVLSPRAPRAGQADAFLAGAFASLTMLGKYWAAFLFAGMAVASLVGPGAHASGVRLRRISWPWERRSSRSACLVDADPKWRQRSVRRERRSIACRSAPHW